MSVEPSSRCGRSAATRAWKGQGQVNTRSFNRYALGCVTIALLTGCAALPLSLSKGQDDTRLPMSTYGTSGTSPALSHRHTLHYTGKQQSFVVPTGVTHVTVVASGASGPYGAGTRFCAVSSGTGGLVQATISVKPGETLAVFVGGEGESGDQCGYGTGSGGFNGGGNGGGSYIEGDDDTYGAGGGGASDVRQKGSGLNDRVIVAAGGGSPGGFTRDGGGAGGGTIGVPGSGQSGSGYCRGYGGGGGGQKKGGKGGRGGPGTRSARGTNGAVGVGGSGGGAAIYPGGGGGGGGGGYFGGGGGGSGGVCSTYADGAGGGGGGGSSYVEPGATNVKDQKGGAPPGSGKVLISW